MDSLENIPFQRLMQKHKKISFSSSDSSSDSEEESKELGI